MKAVVVYSSTNGNTRAVAEYIGEKTGADVFDAKNTASLDLSAYDTVIIGSRVWAGGISGSVEDFLKKNSEELATKRRFLYLCCIYNGEKGDKQLEKIVGYTHIENAAYFNKGKKIIANPGNPVDDFIATF